jgi:hypothetical protein
MFEKLLHGQYVPRKGQFKNRKEWFKSIREKLSCICISYFRGWQIYIETLMNVRVHCTVSCSNF